MATFTLRTPLLKPRDLARLAEIFQAVTHEPSIPERLANRAHSQARKHTLRDYPTADLGRGYGDLGGRWCVWARLEGLLGSA